MNAADDGVKAFSGLTGAGGTATADKSNEGLEAAHIAVSGGTVDVTATDNGVNASRGSDGGPGGRYAHKYPAATRQNTVEIGRDPRSPVPPDSLDWVDSESDFPRLSTEEVPPDSSHQLQPAKAPCQR
ncbi:hypothetical protein [Pseudarthrobacter sp. PvP090]|uniref:hypothetical protein n=1 Tax=Pseudarthrobacter sp. PvP090 TaxID=3156393 RepID=UPI0033958ED3